MTERWLPVPGYEGLYEVSDQGAVRSLPRPGTQGGLLASHDDGENLKVSLSRNGKQRAHTVHKLVLTAFVGERPEGLECCHGDGDHTNNRLGNLRWDTSSSNNRDSVEHGTHSRASRTRCKRGHLLVPPNLHTHRTAKGRQCRACGAARGAHRDNRTTDIDAYADAFYARLEIPA